MKESRLVSVFQPTGDQSQPIDPVILALWGSAVALFLLWLPVMVAAQTLAYAKLTLPHAEAAKALV
jgi:hypothetical protein